MKQELDDALCKAYPKIFKMRHAPMTQTCMCWGFEIGDGWYDIIDNMCSLIQNYINNSRTARLRALRFNRAMSKSLKAGNIDALISYYTFDKTKPVSDWAKTQAVEAYEYGKLKEVPEVCPQVYAEQVKEKFGTLRFYYSGGDEFDGFVAGVVSMAAVMSSVVCPECGDKGELRGGSWLYVSCENHKQ